MGTLSLQNSMNGTISLNDWVVPSPEHALQRLQEAYPGNFKVTEHSDTEYGDKYYRVRVASEHGNQLEVIVRKVDDGWGIEISQSRPGIDWPINSFSLLERDTPLRQPVVDNLLRRGEVMNVIAAPKVGKSWFCYGLALLKTTHTPEKHQVMDQHSQ